MKSLNVIDENIKEYIAKQKDTIIIYSGDIWDVTYQDNDLEKIILQINLFLEIIFLGLSKFPIFRLNFL